MLQVLIFRFIWSHNHITMDYGSTERSFLSHLIYHPSCLYIQSEFCRLSFSLLPFTFPSMKNATLPLLFLCQEREREAGGKGQGQVRGGSKRKETTGSHIKKKREEMTDGRKKKLKKGRGKRKEGSTEKRRVYINRRLKHEC